MAAGSSGAGCITVCPHAYSGLVLALRFTTLFIRFCFKMIMRVSQWFYPGVLSKGQLI